jgi:hypothetical protein
LLFDRATLTGCTKLATVAHMKITNEYNINKLQYDNKTLALGIKGLCREIHNYLNLKYKKNKNYPPGDPVRIGKSAFVNSKKPYNKTLP